MEQKEFKVHVELDAKFSVCFDSDEGADEDRACQYVLDNYMSEIREQIRRNIWAEEVE